MREGAERLPSDPPLGGARHRDAPSRISPGDTSFDVTEEHMENQRTENAYWALRITLGVIPIAAGLDKFTNLLVDWRIYLSPFFERLLPVSPTAFLHLVGVVEIAVGLAVLTAAAILWRPWFPPVPMWLAATHWEWSAPNPAGPSPWTDSRTAHASPPLIAYPNRPPFPK